jgi:hypothetical protein
MLNVGDEHSLEVFQQQLEQHLQQYVNRWGWCYDEKKHDIKILYDPNDLHHKSFI